MIMYMVNGVLVHSEQNENAITVPFTSDGAASTFSVTEFPPPTLPTPMCRECHAENLEDSYQSTRDGTVLCPACYAHQPQEEPRRDRRRDGTKTTHPLDRW
jgi:hypothetical protein